MTARKKTREVVFVHQIRGQYFAEVTISRGRDRRVERLGPFDDEQAALDAIDASHPGAIVQ